jgi:branched-chain amino acid transport system substrate-binding protein
MTMTMTRLPGASTRRLSLTMAAIAALALQAAQPAQAQTTPVKIGFLTELSGPVGAVGQDQYDGFMLAVDRNGGKLGGVPVTIFKEDSQFKPEVGTQLAQKLIDRDGVSIITGLAGSNVMMAVDKPITDKKVFVIGANAAPSPLAGAGCNPYTFITSWQNDNIAEVVGAYATDKGYKKVVLMAPNYQAGKDNMAGFKRYYKGTVADEILTPFNQADMSAELTQVQSEKPDAVFAFFPGGPGVTFVRQYAQAGLLKTTPLLTTGIVDGTTLPALKDTALGIVGGAFWGPDADNAASKEFVADFEKKYNRIPSNFAAQAYDAAQLIGSALAKTKGDVSNKEAFGAALKAADFQSVRGKFRFNNNNFPIHDMHMYEVAKDAQGRVSLKTVATPLKDLQDAYHTQCAMK